MPTATTRTRARASTYEGSRTLLARAILARMNERRLRSFRGAAREIGIAHTTLIRTLEEDTTPETVTLGQIASWLGVTLDQAMRMAGTSPARESKTQALAERLDALLAAHPDLYDAFVRVLDRYERGKLPYNKLERILAFIAFELQ